MYVGLGGKVRDEVGGDDSYAGWKDFLAVWEEGRNLRPSDLVELRLVRGSHVLVRTYHKYLRSVSKKREGRREGERERVREGEEEGEMGCCIGHESEELLAIGAGAGAGAGRSLFFCKSSENASKKSNDKKVFGWEVVHNYV